MWVVNRDKLGVSTNTYLGQPTGWVDDQPHNGVLMGYMMVIQWHLMGFNGIYDDIPSGKRTKSC